MADYSKREKEIILSGLEMYKKDIKKMMKQSENLKTAEKEVKHTFLEVENLINNITQN